MLNRPKKRDKLSVRHDFYPVKRQLWEWKDPWIAAMLWHAHTFQRQVVQRYFATWQTLEAANTQLWATAYAPWPCYAPWPTWHGWFIAYRELLVVTRDVYEAQHGREGSITR